MLKVFISFSFCILLFFSIAACSSPQPKRTTSSSASNTSSAQTESPHSYESTPSTSKQTTAGITHSSTSIISQSEHIGKQNEILARESEAPYHSLITTSYSEKSIFEQSLVMPFVGTSSVSHFVIPVSNADITGFPIECVRKTGENTMYTMYQTNEGGLVYRFFEKGIRGNADLFILTHSIYVKKALKKSDFSSIEKGDSIQKIERIDPIVTLFAAEAAQQGDNTFATAHLLQDGVLSVYYAKSGEAYQIAAIDFFADFVVVDDAKTYNCKIKSGDFISQNLP